MKNFTTLIALLFSVSLIAQTTPISDGGTVDIVCGDPPIILTDAGGDMNYSAGESFEMTFCPDGGNAIVFLIDTETVGDVFDIASTDQLTVFDGPDTSSPILGSFNSQNTTDPVITINATLDNPSGCLTFLFESSTNSVTGAGFTGQVNCGNFWQPFNIEMTTSTSEIDEFNYVDICQGEMVTFTANGDFPFSTGMGYNQTNENSYFEWDLGPGQTFEGFGLTMVQNTYPDAFGYPFTLTVTDTLGLQQIFQGAVRVSTTPNFAPLISQYMDTICVGNSATLVGGITQDTSQAFGVLPVEGSFIGGGFLAGQTFLPDGSGVSYSTTITLDQFEDGQVIQNESDFVAICATMEHSYLGDLDISLACPDGTTVILQAQGGGSCNLGEPWATGPVDGQSANITPGVGYQYCWTPDAMNGTLDQNCVGGIEFTNGDGPGTYTDSQVPAGNYSAQGSFADFIGCPINGDWTITVTDNIGADNGYIFSWGIQFNPDIDPTVETYTPQIIDGIWLAEPTIISNNDTIIVVEPDSPGDYNYTFQVMDNFGCTYDTTVALHVRPEPVLSFTSPACYLESEFDVTNVYTAGFWEFEAPNDSSAAGIIPSTNGDHIDINVNFPGTYAFTYTDLFCNRSYTEEIFFVPPPIAALPDTVEICEGEEFFYTLNQQAAGVDVSHVFTLPDGTPVTTQSVFVDQIGQYTLLVNSETCPDDIAFDQSYFLFKNCDITTYNIFTPNNDGSNDAFHIQGIEEHPGATLEIFNRWGNVVFEEKDYRNDWEMEDLSEGTYYFVLMLPNGEKHTGDFTVLRKN
ncbi:MAG: gliding motility-associated C-terminal domain-containing protein [Bacteroidota bacterium]